MQRICIYPKDVQIITGKSASNSRLLVRRAKKAFNKKPHQLLTVQEFCSFSGLPEAQVQSVVNPGKRIHFT